MQDAGLVGAHAYAHDHVPDLRHRRVGEDALDVPLPDAQDGAEHHRERAYDADQFLGRGRRVPQRREARDQIDAGRHHRGRVDQRGHGGRAFHRVGQPGVKRNLRRFGRAADEERRADQQHEAGRERAGLCEDVPERDRTRLLEQREDREHDADVAEDVDHERLAGGGDGRRLVEPETDQKVGRQPDQTPAHEQPDDVVGEHQREHGKHEEVHVGEEARDRAVVPHVADRVDVDQTADAGDDQRP